MSTGKTAATAPASHTAPAAPATRAKAPGVCALLGSGGGAVAGAALDQVPWTVSAPVIEFASGASRVEPLSSADAIAPAAWSASGATGGLPPASLVPGGGGPSSNDPAGVPLPPAGGYLVVVSAARTPPDPAGDTVSQDGSTPQPGSTAASSGSDSTESEAARSTVCRAEAERRRMAHIARRAASRTTAPLISTSARSGSAAPVMPPVDASAAPQQLPDAVGPSVTSEINMTSSPFPSPHG